MYVCACKRTVCLSVYERDQNILAHVYKCYKSYVQVMCTTPIEMAAHPVVACTTGLNVIYSSNLRKTDRQTDREGQTDINISKKLARCVAMLRVGIHSL